MTTLETNRLVVMMRAYSWETFLNTTDVRIRYTTGNRAAAMIFLQGVRKAITPSNGHILTDPVPAHRQVG